MSSVQRYKELRLSQLRSFCQCVREKSFAGAGRALGISHPVVWQQVRALERLFGVTLLQRQCNQLELTEDGNLFYELAGSIVTSMDGLEQAFKDRRSALPRCLRVAGSSTVFNRDLPLVVAAFCCRHPEIRLELSVYPREQIEDLIATGQVHTAIVSHGPCPPVNSSIDVEQLCERAWHLIVPKGHPLAKRRRIAAADIVRYPLILVREDGDLSEPIKAALAEAGPRKLKVVLEIDSAQSACHYVGLGLGLAIIPIARGGLRFPNTCAHPLGHLFPPDQLVALWRRGAKPQPQARLFIDFARQYLHED